MNENGFISRRQNMELAKKNIMPCVEGAKKKKVPYMPFKLLTHFLPTAATAGKLDNTWMGKIIRYAQSINLDARLHEKRSCTIELVWQKVNDTVSHASLRFCYTFGVSALCSMLVCMSYMPMLPGNTHIFKNSPLARQVQ